uniref:PX domain-containing protein n=1 Tax=Globisporangium ultimum (strain ATCC 200006 / CBS 805.95 / DAOM BR144) TaxID=431595 RepID=K3X9R4_GLOUD
MASTAPLLPHALTPVPVVPRRPSVAHEPLAALEKIDAIEINSTVERDGVVYFVLDVYLKRYTQSRIPTLQKALAEQKQQDRKGVQCRRGQQPDYQIQKRFTDFADLRYQVWVHAQKTHGCRCAYCDAFMDFIVHSLAQPRLLVKLATGTKTRKKLFTTFCNQFVHLAVANASEPQTGASREPRCEASQVIPVYVERFFRKQG